MAGAALTRSLLIGLLLALAGGTALVRWDIAQRREAFATDARIAHRLLSQRAVEVEAVLATVALLDVPESARLPALHAAILRVVREPRPTDAAPSALPQLDARELPSGRVRLWLDGTAARHRMDLELARLVPTDTWPLAADGPVRAELRWADARFVLQAGAAPSAAPAGLTAGFIAAKAFDAAALRLELQLQRATGPAEWPWLKLTLMWGAIVVSLAAAQAWQAQRERRHRAEALLRLDRLGRLNAMGEVAAGLAHELNQPLTAALTQAQVAARWLAEARESGRDSGRDVGHDEAAAAAIAQAAAQTRRAADIVRRLRDHLEHPGSQREPVDMGLLLREALHLREPELAAAGIELQEPIAPAPPLLADRVALQQIVHNLIANAVQALQTRREGPRRLTLALQADGGELRLTVADTGPGIAPELLPRLFHPFVSGREGGLGLGLSLSERLAGSMGGRLVARNRSAAEGGGAEFTLLLPLVAPPVQHHGP